MTDIERMDFLIAYEALGPGGLTPAEIIELAMLRAKLTPLTHRDNDVVYDFAPGVYYFHGIEVSCEH